MARRILVFDPPDRFVVDAVGRPGARTFYLQARQDDRVASVVLEKVQVAALAERLGILLGELRRRGAVPAEGEAGAGADDAGAGPAAAGSTETAGLEEPIEPIFRVGTLSLTWDTGSDAIVLEATEMTGGDEEGDEDEEADDDDPDGPDVLRVRLSAGAARAFAARAERVVAAGRPPCPWCGQPLDPHGHFCPRRNGGRAN